MTRIAFRPDIEGLRGVAVLLVVLYHAGVPFVTGGYVGVDVFFVLSGYLITRILVQEAAAEGRISLVDFYARRVRRLLPAASLVLVVTTLLSALVFSPLEQSRQLSAAAVACAAYASNMYFAYASTDYLGAAGDENPLLHTWSLSVEEQFYLAWPLLVALSLGVSVRSSARTRTALKPGRLLVVIGVVCAVSFALCAWLTGRLQPWAFFLAPARAWEFALGAAASFLSPGQSRRRVITGWVGLVAILAAALGFGAATPFPGIAAALPGLGASAVLFAGDAPDGRRETTRSATALLATAPLVSLGSLSYSLYLWHWPLIVFARVLAPDAGAAGIGLAAALSFVPAWLSYSLLERPIRAHAKLALRPTLALALGAALTVGGVGTAYAWRVWSSRMARSGDSADLLAVREGDPARGECHGRNLDFFETWRDPCVLRGRPDGPRVWLVGDSHAQHWIPAMELASQERGWTVSVATKSACPVADLDFVLPAVRREYHECSAWRERVFESIEREHPDLVVLASSDEIVGDGAMQIRPDSWERGVHTTLARLAEASTRVVYVQDTPRPGFDAPACLARNRWASWLPVRACEFAASAHRPSVGGSAIVRAVASVDRANVRVVDLSDLICPGEVCAVEREGEILFRDDNHLSAAFCERLGPALVERSWPADLDATGR